MPSSANNDLIPSKEGIGGDSDSEGGDKKRIKLEIQLNSDEDDSGMDEFEDEVEEEDDADDLICNDQRSLAERCFGPPFQYWILTAGGAYQKMVDCVSECQRIIAQSHTTVRVLLNRRSWDTEKLYEDYFQNDLSTLFKTSGLRDPTISSTDAQEGANISGDCDICLAALHPSNIFTAGCGHSFCNDCWKHYLLTKVMSGNGQEKIECPAQSCQFLMEDDFVMKKMDLSKAEEMYKKQITESYVQSNRRMNWCPGANCPGHVIELEEGSANWCPVTCMCSYSFCFNCREQWHGPITCKLLKRWNKKCADDSETINWISVNTKQCPKCEAPIEKNGGCNHMSCKNSACGFHFCWICLGDWNAHQRDNAYNCNRFPDGNNLNSNSQVASREHSLKRYLFYFDRYFNHHKSLKSENTLIRKMDLKIVEFIKHGVSSDQELQFLKKAVQVLCQCRQTLMYTYVFAYYLARNNNACIFEDNQSDLQRATEALSGYLENDFEYNTEGLDSLKLAVMDKTKYCESRCEVLLKHVYEGYDELGYWTYIEPETTVSVI